jgi:hypothetical protein
LKYWKGGYGILKYYGMAFSNKDWMVKKLREIEFGEMHTAASYFLAFPPPLRKLAIAIYTCICLHSIFKALGVNLVI